MTPATQHQEIANRLEMLVQRQFSPDCRHCRRQLAPAASCSQCGVRHPEITPETRFEDDLGADSLDTIELIMEAEDAFEISIPDEEGEGLKTFGQAVDYVRERLAEKAKTGRPEIG